MSIWVCGASAIGKRKYNDDHFSIADKVGQDSSVTVQIDVDSPWFSRLGLIAAVADGMGSYQGGALASRTVLETLSGVFYKIPGADLQERVRLSIDAALKRLQAVLRKERKRKAGTTLAGVALQAPSQMVVFHVGDSGVVRVREGKMARLTVDHTPIGEALARRELTLAEAVNRRDAHQLTRSMGLIGDTTPDIRPLDFAPGDWYLLMTDGVCSPGRGLSPKGIKNCVERAKPPLHSMLDPMLSAATMNDGDNATLVVVHVGYR